MVFVGAIEPKRRAYIAFLARDKGFKTVDIVKKCQVSRATVYRIRKESFLPSGGYNKRCAGGRPKKLCPRDERKLVRSLATLRKQEGQFSSKRLMQDAGLQETQVSNRTIRRFLNGKGYHYLQARKKGLMSACDMRKRVNFAKEMQKKYSPDVWKDSVAFFLDGVSFYYKRNPADQARAPKGRVWRKRNEGLKQGCTAKGSKEGSGGRVLHLMVAISYGKGVIQCHQYNELDGRCFSKFLEENIDGMFIRADKNGSRLFVQDNASTQNSALVRRVLRQKRAKQLHIPPRSPDINAVENLFNLIKVELRKQALKLNITHETFEQFATRVIRTMYNFPVHVIDKIIDTMSGRIQAIINGKGERTKY